MATHEQIESWIFALVQKDREAFDALYVASSAKLFGVCLRVLKDRADAEEALQEVYLKIWHNADRYSAGVYSPMTWLITLARNHAIDHLRAREARRQRASQSGGKALDLVSDPKPGPEARVVAASEQRALEVCMETLPEDRADALRGAYLDGDSYKTLAARYEVPLNTMRTWLRRSLIALKECLGR